MQAINIDISDSGTVIIEDHVYYAEKDGTDGAFCNTTTNEKILLKVYTDFESVENIENFECDVLAAEENKNGFKHIICPRVIKQNNDEGFQYYVLTEISDFPKSDVHKLSDSLSVSGFSIYSRIMAATNLAESLSVIYHYVGKNILSIHPEEIYINTENGDVYIWIEHWLDKISDENPADDFGFSPEWYSRDEKNVTETDMRFFMAYIIFRLLLNDEPFDGSETLLQFPLLTDEAVRLIRKNKFGFVLSKGSNYMSEYIGQGLWKKWCALPAFFRMVIEKNFTEGIDIPDERTEIPQWLKLMRRLRDCIVYVNGQFRFCDPDVSNKVLFMVIGDYKIPVWPKKAVYWYHVDVSMNESKNGVVAGVTLKDGHYYLSNLSGNPWMVTFNNSNYWIHPEHEVEIIEGMTIQFENKKIIEIIDGMTRDQKKTIHSAVQDTLNDVLSESDDIDDEEDSVSMDT